MALDDDIRILSEVSLFEALDSEQLRLLAFGAETMRFPQGREIYREGAPADCAYVVASGDVAVVRDVEGQRVVLSRYGPGSILGELALIASTQRLTGAEAETDVHAIRLSRTLFRRILEEYPEVAAKLHDRIAHDLQTLIRQIETLGPRFAD